MDYALSDDSDRLKVVVWMDVEEGLVGLAVV